MKKFMKTFSIMLVLLVAFGACAPKKSEAPAPAPAPAPQPSGPFANVEPLKTPTELGIGLLSGTHASSIVYFIGKLGGFEKVGIKPKITAFANGPVMVEAMNSGAWDFGVYGLGGTLAGSLGYGAKVVGAATRDAGSLQFFAPNDSPIVKSGKNMPQYPSLYGTKEIWKGKEIYLPTGTTLHFTLATALSKFGLTESDVKIVHMDVPNINTALRAGQCPVGALWTSLPYGDINEKFTPVIKGADLVSLVNVLAANPDSYKDPVKTEAIKKMIELYYLTVEWLWDGTKLNEKNKQQAFDWYLQWNEENGVKANARDIEMLMLDSRHYTLEESYKLATTKTPDGKMTLMEQANYDPLAFFIKLNRYKPEDGEKLLAGTHDGKYVIEIYEKRKK